MITNAPTATSEIPTIADKTCPYHIVSSVCNISIFINLDVNDHHMHVMLEFCIIWIFLNILNIFKLGQFNWRDIIWLIPHLIFCWKVWNFFCVFINFAIGIINHSNLFLGFFKTFIRSLSHKYNLLKLHYSQNSNIGNINYFYIFVLFLWLF